MNLLKRLATLVMCAAVGATMFAGCGETAVQPEAPTPTDIKLSGMKTEFAYGEEFSSANMVVTVVYSDASEKNVSAKNYSVDSSAYRATEAGSYDIKVTYQTLEKTYTVKVGAAPAQEATPKELKCTTTKPSFEYGEAFSREGLTVTAVYTDNTEKAVPLDECQVDYSAYDPNETGEHEIVVAWNGLITTYTVTVEERAPEKDWEEDGVFKILMFGNSYTDDTSQYIWELCESLGFKARVYRISGGTYDLEKHYTQLVDDTPADTNSSHYNTDGTWVANPGVTHRELIEMTDWDFITLQHQSAKSARPNEFNFMGALLRQLDTLLEGKHTKVVWLMTWAYPQTSKNGDFSKFFGANQMKMYEALVETTKEVILPTGILVDPIGTAIQNARTSLIGDNLCRDDIHLSYGLGRYIAGLTTVSYLTGHTIPENVFAPSGTYAFSAEYKRIALESVRNAIASPFTITQSEYPPAP